MSVQRQSTTATCKHCDQRIFDYYAPGYCSPLCYFKEQGRKLLNTVRHDHTQCVQCGTQLKTVEPPTDEQLRKIDGMHSANAVVGFEYTTKNADVGFKDLQSESGERVITGVVCGSCGNTNQHKEFPEMQDRHLFEYAYGILETLREKESEHNTTLCEDTFFEMLYATGDIEFSLGKAAEA